MRWRVSRCCKTKDSWGRGYGLLSFVQISYSYCFQIDWFKNVQEIRLALKIKAEKSLSITISTLSNPFNSRFHFCSLLSQFNLFINDEILTSLRFKESMQACPPRWNLTKVSSLAHYFRKFIYHRLTMNEESRNSMWDTVELWPFTSPLTMTRECLNHPSLITIPLLKYSFLPNADTSSGR